MNVIKELTRKGGGLRIPIDRDQQNKVFLNDPQNTFPLKENKKNFPKSKTLTKYPPKTRFIQRNISTRL